MLFIVSDLHIWHDALIRMGVRKEGFTETLFENWRRLIGADDVVIDLGDVIFRKVGSLSEIMAGLPGTKLLVRGNHDRKSDEWFKRHGYRDVMNSLTIGDILFTHKPETPLPDGIRICVHGHLHRNGRMAIDVVDNEYYQSHYNQYLLVDIDDSLAPEPLEDFLKRNGVELPESEWQACRNMTSKG